MHLEQFPWDNAFEWDTLCGLSLFLSQRNVSDWPIQSADLNPSEHVLHLLKTRLKAKCPQNKQELSMAAIQTWQSISREFAKYLFMSTDRGFQLFIDSKGFATKPLTVVLTDLWEKI